MMNPIQSAHSSNRGPTSVQWQAQKEKIWELYRVQNLTHKELAKQMTKIFGCQVTEKMCKDRTTKWDFGKTVKSKEYEAMIRQQSMRQQNDEAFWVRGKQVKPRDLRRYIKRRKTEDRQGQPDLYPLPNEAQSPSGFSLPDQANTPESSVSDPSHHAMENSYRSADEGGATVELAADQLAALEERACVLDTIQGVTRPNQGQKPSESSLNVFSPVETLLSLIVTPTWPNSPICRLLLREESEYSLADSVHEMRTLLNHGPFAEGEQRLETPLTPPPANLIPAAEEPFSPSSRTFQSSETNEVASNWISICSLAAMQHPYGKSGLLQYALNKASVLFKDMLIRHDRQLLSAIVVLGAILEANGKEDSVDTVLMHTWKASGTIHGQGHFLTITIAWMVNALSKKGDRAWVSSSKLNEICYAFERDYGRLHPYYAISLFNLANALDLGNYIGEAEPKLQELVELCQQVFAPGHPQTIIAQMKLARLAFKLEHHVEARSYMDLAVSSSHNRWGAEHPYTLKCLEQQGVLLDKLGETEQTEKILQRVLKGRIKSLGCAHRLVYDSRSDLAYWLKGQGRKEESNALERNIYEWAGENCNDGMTDDFAVN